MLVPIQGKSLITRTAENVMGMASIDQVIVATDDPRIRDHLKPLKVPVIMTSVTCPNGTERIVEALNIFDPEKQWQTIINIQGDEPCIWESTLTRCIQKLAAAPQKEMVTAIRPITSEEDFLDPSVVKCVTDHTGKALYFSRSPIPYFQGKPWAPHTAQAHLGIYVYGREFLETYVQLPSSALQTHEDLEQLRALEAGYSILTVTVNDPAIGVNQPQDIKKVEQYLCNLNTSSSQAVSSPA